MFFNNLCSRGEAAVPSIQIELARVFLNADLADQADPGGFEKMHTGMKGVKGIVATIIPCITFIPVRIVRVVRVIRGSALAVGITACG